MKKIRKNALKLFLFVCLGLTLTTIVYASTRINGDVPSPPGRPEVVDVWDDGCQLNYIPPVNNGGSPVINYVIEYRYSLETIWKIKGTSNTDSYRVYDMREGRAEFRIIAINKFGASEPSRPSEFVTFKD